MSDFDNLTSPPPAPGGEASQDQRTMALLAHILGIFTGFLGSLIIWLVNKDNPEKSFVTDQAKEALNFNITVMIASIVLILVTVFTLFIAAFITIPLGILLGIAWLVLTIIAAMKANEGVAYRYPFTLRLLS